MTRKQRRLGIIAGLGTVVVVAFGLILFALRDQIVFFYSPTDVHEKGVAVGTAMRLGGLVKANSCARIGDETDFVVTDGQTDMPVRFTGILPDLFRSGQGVIAEGTLATDGSFSATNILAKHDENYVPKEVVAELKKRGEWGKQPEAVALTDDNCSPAHLTVAEAGAG